MQGELNLASSFFNPSTPGLRPAGEGANLDSRLVPYTRAARRTKSHIEFIYIIYIY